MTSVLVSRNDILEKMLKRAVPTSVILSYSDLDSIPQQALQCADIILYDESSVGLTKLMGWEAASRFSMKLIILTEKCPEMIRSGSPAKVFSYPINLGEIYNHVANFGN